MVLLGCTTLPCATLRGTCCKEDHTLPTFFVYPSRPAGSWGTRGLQYRPCHMATRSDFFRTINAFGRGAAEHRFTHTAKSYTLPCFSVHCRSTMHPLQTFIAEDIPAVSLTRHMEPCAKRSGRTAAECDMIIFSPSLVYTSHRPLSPLFRSQQRHMVGHRRTPDVSAH